MKPIIEIEGKRVVIIGHNGSGKSSLGKYLLNHLPISRTAVYDPEQEHNMFRNYLPEDSNSIEELNKFVYDVVIPQAKSGRLMGYMHDEINVLCPPKPSRLPKCIADINNQQRHWGRKLSGYDFDGNPKTGGMTFISICRLVDQIHKDLVSLSDMMFIFRFFHHKEKKILNGWAEGLGDVVQSLDDYEFVMLKGNKYIICNPLKIQKTLPQRKSRVPTWRPQEEGDKPNPFTN